LAVGSPDRRLEVVETESAYLVTEAGDPEDWLVLFEKNPRFPAMEWAENMVGIFNLRVGRPPLARPKAPGSNVKHGRRAGEGRTMIPE
jgi:hypothetical protein